MGALAAWPGGLGASSGLEGPCPHIAAWSLGSGQLDLL